VAVNEKTMFLGLSDYEVMYYSLETMAPIWTKPKAHRSKINQVCQLDEKTFATCSSDASIRLWDVTTGKDV
jgi:WD40 repeat protein